MKGFKLRIPEVDTFRAMTEAWGAKPTPLNFSELYLALSQGAVDGQENPLPTIQSAKLFEVQKYLVLTGHIITPRLIAINEPIWAGLTDKERGSLHKALAEHGMWQDNEIVDQESKLVDTFKTGGMTVIEPDLESFRKPVLASVPAKFESKWGKGSGNASPRCDVTPRQHRHAAAYPDGLRSRRRRGRLLHPARSAVVRDTRRRDARGRRSADLDR